jgi:bifunctional ADP-heptose synthase (sugar kinase/adenylyltransferase)
MVKILVIGETCTDIFIYGKSDRLSPEAPVPVFIPIESTKNMGMSGNVIENLKSLDNDLEITHWYQKNQITKTRYVDKKSNHMFIRIDEGELDVCDSFGELNNDLIEIIQSQDIVIISDYNKGFLTEKNIYDICNYSKLSIVDSKKKISSKTVVPITWLKLNEKEWEYNSELHNIWGDKILKTMGSKGTWYNGKLYPSNNPKETIDVSGAGDTFVASFILNFYKTKLISQSIDYANSMSSIVVSKRGVATP